MKFIAHINIMPLKDLLDPQGKAVNSGLHQIGLQGVHDVRIGKHIVLQLEVADKDIAATTVQQACKQLLANQVMETFEFTLTEA